MTRARRTSPLRGSKGGMELPNGGMEALRGTVIICGRRGSPIRVNDDPAATRDPSPEAGKPGARDGGAGTTRALVPRVYPRGCKCARGRPAVAPAGLMADIPARAPPAGRVEPLMRPGAALRPAPGPAPLRMPPPSEPPRDEPEPIRACAFRGLVRQTARMTAPIIAEPGKTRIQDPLFQPTPL